MQCGDLGVDNIAIAERASDCEKAACLALDIDRQAISFFEITVEIVQRAGSPLSATTYVSDPLQERYITDKQAVSAAKDSIA